MQVRIEARGLGLETLLVLLLLLTIGIEAHACLLAVETGVVVWLESSGLGLLESSIGVVHVASRLRLVLLNRVGKEVNGVSLLVSLVEASVLWLAGLLLRSRIVVEKRGSVAVLEFPAPSFFLFLTKLDCFRQIVIVIWSVLSTFALLPVFLLLILACLQS